MKRHLTRALAILAVAVLSACAAAPVPTEARP